MYASWAFSRLNRQQRLSYDKSWLILIRQLASADRKARAGLLLE